MEDTTEDDDAGQAAALASLYAHRDQLAGRLAAADRAILALTAVPRPVPVTRSARGLWPLLRAMITEMGPGEQFDVPHARKWLEARGWETTARDRRQAVATGCSRFLQQGLLKATTQKGIYEIPGRP